MYQHNYLKDTKDIVNIRVLPSIGSALINVEISRKKEAEQAFALYSMNYSKGVVSRASPGRNINYAL